jgi:proteasome-associated ATPase
MADRSRNRRNGEERPPFEPAGPGRPEGRMRALAILEEILKYTPQNDPRIGLLELLYEQLQADERQLREAQETIRQFNETYEKLTAPANRIGTFLGSPQEGIAYIVVGDAEYYANVDPKLDLSTLKSGHAGQDQ